MLIRLDNIDEDLELFYSRASLHSTDSLLSALIAEAAAATTTTIIAYYDAL